MNKRTTYSEIIKFRITKEEKDAIEKTAKEKNVSVSAAMRSMLFDQSNNSSYAVEIQKNLERNAFFNRIQQLKLPKKTKQAILEELIKCAM